MDNWPREKKDMGCVGGKGGTWQGKAANLMARMPRKEEETRLPQSSLRPGP